MKTFLRKFCPCVSLCVISAAVLLGFLYLLQMLIRTGVLFFQIVAVLLLVSLALAFVAGVVLLILKLRNKSRVPVAAENPGIRANGCAE